MRYQQTNLLRPGAADGIAARISAEIPQTLTISAESRSDIDDVVAVLKTALESKKWVITKIDHGALWVGGKAAKSITQRELLPPASP